MSRSMNALYRNSAFLCAAAMILAACSENTTTPTPRGISPEASSANQYPEFNGPSAGAHILHTRQWFAENPADNNAHARPGGGGGGSTNNGIFYHGGSLLTAATNVAAVYWATDTVYRNGPTAGGSGTDVSNDGSLVGYFLSHLGPSSYFNINSTYYDASNTHVANLVNYTQYWANNSYDVPANGESVSDSRMLSMLEYGFNHSKLTYDANTLYIIMTAGTTNLGGGFGTQYCAYHGYGTVTVGGVSHTVLYSAMPYTHAYTSGCTSGTASPNGDPAADAEVNVIAHETEETTTDGMLNAWYDRRGYENADKCAWNFGTTHTASNGGVWNITVGTKNFLVQQNWVNANGGSCKQGWP